MITLTANKTYYAITSAMIPAYGDADLSGTVDIYDALLVLKYASGEETLSEQQILNGDINADGVTNADDAMIIMEYNAGWYQNANVPDEPLIPRTTTVSFSPNGNSTYSKSQSTAVTVTSDGTISSMKYLWSTENDADASSGTTFTNGSTITKTSGDGIYYLCIYTIDDLGHGQTICSEAFYLDTTGPTITPNTTTMCLAKGSTLDLSSFVMFTDDHSGVNKDTLSIKNGSTEVTNLSSYETGSYGVTYNVSDNAGNAATYKTIIFKIYSKVIGDQAIATSGDGLYEDSYESGRYIYRGTDPNNYVSYGGKTWRIVAIEADGTYKLVNLDSGISGAWDTENGRSDSSYSAYRYCNTPTYGCNAWGMIAPDGATYTYAIGDNSYVNNYLNGDSFYGTLTDTSAIYTDAQYNIGKVYRTSSYTIANILAEEQAVTDTGPVGLLNVSDYMRASTSTTCSTYANATAGNCASNNWLGNSTVTSGDGYWLINGVFDSNNRYLVFNAKSTGLANTYPEYTRTYYPVIYLKNTTTFTGSGTSSDPYVVNSSCQVEQTNEISSTTCSISVKDPTIYETSKLLTITPSSTTGITYSWDFINFGSTNTKTVSAAGTYSGFIKDSENATNSCSVDIVSRTEYQSTSCPTENLSFGGWYLRTTGWLASCSAYSQSEAEAAYANWYRVCDYVYMNANACRTKVGTNTCYFYKEYSRSGSCSSFEGGTVSEWTSTEIIANFKTQVATRITYAAG